VTIFFLQTLIITKRFMKECSLEIRKCVVAAERQKKLLRYIVRRPEKCVVTLKGEKQIAFLIAYLLNDKSNVGNNEYWEYIQ